MKRSAILLVIGLLLVAGGAWAATAGPYALSWFTVDGGGHIASQGGEYTLGGTAGQPDAGMLTGGGYTLGGGFWRGGVVAAANHLVYLPVVLRGF